MNICKRKVSSKNWRWLFVVITAMSLLISACVATPASNGGSADAAKPAESASASLPGEGITVKGMYSGIIDELFQQRIVEKGLEKLGYTIGERAEGQYPAIHLAIANGDVDFFSEHWMPLHEAFYKEAGGDAVMTRLGKLVDGAAQGYLIDKATADKYGITNLGDLKDPEKAKLFDSDGDGKANLIGCDPGWGCERVIEHHLDAYELRDIITHDQGSYFALIADGITRFKEGKPVLFYTWTPMWLGGVLLPGRDVVWLNVPFSSGPDGDVDTAAPDGSNTGFGLNTIRITANNKFLEANPAAKKLFELMEISIGDVMAENLLINNGEKTVEDIDRHADEWIAANQASFDSWIAEALKAAGK